MLRFFKKKHAPQDDLYMWCIYALADTLLMCDATGNPFNPNIFANKVIERIEREGFLLSQEQADQIKKMREIIVTKRNGGQLGGIFELLTDAHTDNVEKMSSGIKSERATMSTILFCAAFLEKELKKEGLVFDLSAETRVGLDETYRLNVGSFNEALQNTPHRK